VVAYAQGAQQAPLAGAAGVVGTARTVDETTLAIEDRAVAPTAGFKPAGQNTLTYFIRMVVVLALVVAAIYLFFRFMKRLSRPRLGDDSDIKVLASAGLGTGKALHVVSLGTKAFLIGASESSISLISEIQDKEYVDALALKAASAPRGQGTGFAELLGSMLGGKGRKAAGRTTGGSGFLAAQRERLRKF
jgi:flagellar protein FliO/FliZ